MCFNLPGCELAAVQSRWVRARGKRVYHFTRGCFNGLFWLWIFQSCEKADTKTMTKFHSLYTPFASVWRPSDRWSSSSWILHDAENTRWGSAMWYMDVFSPELKNVHQFRYCCQSRKVCSSFRSMFFWTDGECDFGSPNDSLLLDDKFFTCISSACRIHALRHVSQISTSLYIYICIYIYIWHLSLSLSIYICILSWGQQSEVPTYGRGSSSTMPSCMSTAII